MIKKFVWKILRLYGFEWVYDYLTDTSPYKGVNEAIKELF